jgi:hypothetical protein
VHRLAIVMLASALAAILAQQTTHRVGQTRGEATSDKRILDVYGSVAEEPWKLGQDKGEAGTGVVINETNGKLYLDTKPCEAKVKTFSEPYEKADTGKTVPCKGHQLPVFFIRQK